MQKEYKRGFGPYQEEGLFGFGLGWDSVDAYPYSQYGIQSLIKGGDTFLYHGSMIVLPEYNMAFAALLSSGGSSPNARGIDFILRYICQEHCSEEYNCWN
jgi:hypothetical protein